jgi:hypothetical protein
MIGEEAMCAVADLGRDKISSLVLIEPARDPKLYGVAESGWKLAGPVKGGGTMKTKYNQRQPTIEKKQQSRGPRIGVKEKCDPERRWANPQPLRSAG